MIDSHCHLDFKDFNHNRLEIIESAVSSGVHTLINIGADLESSERTAGLTDEHDCIYGTVGIHPHDAKTYDKNAEDIICRLLESKKIVGIGEIGLDFYRDLSPREIQKHVFKRQLEIAVEKDMPVVIHTRESLRQTVEIVREYAGRLPGGVFHCFPGTADDAFEVIDLGFLIGIGGVVTFPKARMALVAEEIPLEYILLETDCPYLAPVPFRGKTNQPAYVKYVAEKIAELKNMKLAEVEKITDRNCRKLFRLVEIFGG